MNLGQRQPQIHFYDRGICHVQLHPCHHLLSRIAYEVYIHFFCYIFRYIVSKCIAEAIHLEKPKHLIIWNEESTTNTIAYMALFRSEIFWGKIPVVLSLLFGKFIQP
jgi:hypothetical protein